ncbi:MAG: hypothetical protein EOO46_21495, partial [Flavobacterium sp.]
SFKNADIIAQSCKGNDLKNLPELAYKLTKDLHTDVEKFRAIYIWVCTNIESDYNGFRKNHVKRSKFQNDSLQLNNWTKTFSNNVFKKLLKEKKTVCTGYAYLIKKLANLANINCEIIDGYGRTANSIEKQLQFPNHSWNAVQLNNKWYLCDATWSSGSFNLSNFTFEFNYNDGYFLSSPELFAKNHFPIENSWFLMNEKPILSDFLDAPLVYGNAFIYNIFPTEPSSMFLEIKKNEEIVFSLKELKSFDTKFLFLEIASGDNSQISQPKINRNKDGLIQIKHLFSTRGLYDVQIKLMNDVICSYVVKVKS